MPMKRIRYATPTRRKLAASSAKARTIPKTRFKQRASPNQRRPQASSGLIKVASTFAGTVSVSLAAATMTPSVTTTVVATIAGLIGSGLLVKRYG